MVLCMRLFHCCMFMCSLRDVGESAITFCGKATVGLGDLMVAQMCTEGCSVASHGCVACMRLFHCCVFTCSLRDVAESAITFCGKVTVSLGDLSPPSHSLCHP